MIKLGLMQVVLADYNKPFFEKLAQATDVKLSVFADINSQASGVRTARSLQSALLAETNSRVIFPGKTYSLIWQSGFFKWINEFAPDILVISTNPRVLNNWIAIVWMKARGTPVIGWGLGELERAGPSWFAKVRRWLSGILIRRLDLVIAYSTKGARDYRLCGVPQEKIAVAYNALDNTESDHFFSIFGYDKSWMVPWKTSLGLDKARIIILFVGRLIESKNIEMLIAACADYFDRCQLLIVGDGPHKGVLYEAAEPYREHIVFAGYKAGEELAKCFIGADMFVLPSFGGLAIYQAMSYGKPVIASFADGTEEDLIVDGENGFLFEPGNKSDLSDKIALMLNKQNCYAAMGEIAIKIVGGKASMENMVNVFTEAITRVHAKQYKSESCS